MNRIAIEHMLREIGLRCVIIEPGSTQSYARANSVAIDTVFVAESQPNGRGRGTKHFVSNPGGAYCSIVLKRSGTPREMMRYALLGALAVIDVLDGYGIAGGIKWPNDIKVGDKKISGMLTEYDASANSVILGIGINVNNALNGVEEIAVSMRALGIRTTPEEVIAKLCVALQARETCDDYLKDYRARCVTLGLPIVLEDGTPAVAKEIDAGGFLIAEVEGGKRVTVANPGFLSPGDPVN